jgi:cytochrome c1
MKKSIYLLSATVLLSLLVSCGGSETKTEEASTTEPPKSMIADPVSYDPKRGEGKFSADNVTIGALDEAMAAKGEAIAGTKCTSCHKLSDEKLVGPGWKGVSERRTAHWIMNFITNPDPMIDKDPEVQAQLELCLVRMPNQSLTDNDARDLVEFMRKNDGAK